MRTRRQENRAGGEKQRTERGGSRQVRCHNLETETRSDRDHPSSAELRALLGRVELSQPRANHRAHHSIRCMETSGCYYAIAASSRRHDAKYFPMGPREIERL